MKITSDTKISNVFKENKDAIDLITSINQHFKKLKNPVLRKVLAPRVTIKDAAKIGNITTREILQKLESIGFQVAYDDESTNVVIEESKFTEEITNVVTLDVRPTIAAGADPFKEIMGAIKKMSGTETLEIINVFEPTPLIQILKGKGYKTWTDKVDEDEYHTYFKKESDSSHQEIVADMPIAEGSFDEKLSVFGENLVEIDVRLLEMPEPMVTILSELETLPDTHVLLVNHKKMPQFLLPELENRNYQIMSKEIEEGFVQLIIYKG
jgi:uncharacterized protein (DUF2249 family)